MAKAGLGKGLDALLGAGAGGGKTTPASGGGGGGAGAGVGAAAAKIALDKLVAGKYQPRRHFAKESLQTLAESIRKSGVIQPIIVRPISVAAGKISKGAKGAKGGKGKATDGGEKYEIIAGERRYRAAKLAGLVNIPAVVREVTDRDAQLFALIENLQRADLNPIEQAQGIAKLISDANITHAAAAESVGMSRPAVSNLLRLLELTPSVQNLLMTGKLEMGQARPLLALPASKQEAAAKQVIAQGLTAREAEKLARQLLVKKSGGGAAGATSTRGAKNADTAIIERELSQKLAMRVDIKHRKNGSGKLTLHYGSLDSLQKALDKLKK